MPPKAAANKKKSVAAAAPAEEPVTAAVAVPAPVEPAASPKKKAKKPIKVVAVVTPDGIEGTFAPEPRRPLIAHLQIRSSDVQFADPTTQYDPNPPGQPEPYNPEVMDVFTTEHASVEVIAVPKEEPAVPAGKGIGDIMTTVLYKAGERAAVGSSYEKPDTVTQTAAAATESRPLQCFAKAELMVQFREANKVKQLPETTDVACYWCCHAFSWQPCIIPEREVGGIYNVYGNFCCPECAMAYLLTENVDPHVRWERIALLHRIYDVNGTGRIHPAPPREMLKIFGGPTTIESFRATTRAGKVRVDLHMPPMVSILGSIDTKPIDFFDSGSRLGAGGLREMEKIQKAEEGLRLRRTKPLKDRESTLDTVMNIQVRSGGGR